nr:MAG TPA: hypothetical protein [Caudoviricetes sp.]
MISSFFKIILAYEYRYHDFRFRNLNLFTQ